MIPRQKEINRAVGLALRSGREKKVMPQTTAAKKLRITSTYLSALENGRVTASIELIAKAEKLYGTEIFHVD